MGGKRHWRKVQARDFYRKQRRLAIKRDKRCVGRGAIEDSTLTTHHIVHKSKGGSDDHRNPITLCKDCHKDMHRRPNGTDIV
jgi:5-methylcytosine-specific restriction endonuclease McrA